MKKNLPLLLLLSLLCIYAFLNFQKPGFFQEGPPTAAGLSKFVDSLEKICLFIGASLFTILAFSQAGSVNAAKQSSSRVWFGGIFTILGASTILVLFFNPTGAFTWNLNQGPKWDYRLTRVYQYSKLASAPDIVFLGTSVSAEIPIEKYARRSFLTGFKLGVIGGTVVDYFTMTNIIASKPTPEKKPGVIITEVLSPSLRPSHNGVEYYKRYPLEYVKYMPPKFALETISRHFEDIFALSSFSKAIYWNKPRIKIPNLGPKRTGKTVIPDRLRRTVSLAQNKSVYKQHVILLGKDLDILLQCAELDADGQDLILKMVALGKEQHISMVFYRSPINDDFYTFLKKKPEMYKACGEKFNQFMKQIQAQNPNVFYVDLSAYAPVSSGGDVLYKDSHHLTRAGSDRVLETLTPTIQVAIQQARSR